MSNKKNKHNKILNILKAWNYLRKKNEKNVITQRWSRSGGIHEILSTL